MLKLSKLTDYAIILLSVLSKDNTSCYSASTLSTMTSIPEPTTAKILKMLSSGDLVLSLRGSRGGYKAIESYDDISLAQIVEVMEGNIAITECTNKVDHVCNIKQSCPMDGGWNVVNSALYDTLNGIKLSSLLNKAEVREVT